MFIGTETPMHAIAEMEVKRPSDAGDHWKGIKHIDLIDGIRSQLDYRGINVLTTTASVERNEAKDSLIGYFLVSPNVSPIDGQNYMLGFRHSNDLRNPLVLSIGTLITICHNGMITGEYIMRKKHTKNLDLEHELFVGIRDVASQFEGVEKTVYNMRMSPLDRNEYESIVVRGARKNIYPWSWIGKIDDEYNNPSEDNPECGEYKGTRWGVYNAFNYVMKHATPERQARSLHRFMPIVN